MATQINQTPVDLRRRSKGGCIDCKAAKVRCDESRPSCGTCARRGRRCRGYNPLLSAGPHSSEKKPKFIFYHPANERRRRSIDILDAQLDAQTSELEAASIEAAVEESADRSSSLSSTVSIQRDVEPTSNQVEILGLPVSMAVDLTASYESMISFFPMPQSLRTIPPGAIPADDAETINLYFNRHPFEQVISLEFVDEMNASTWMVFEDNPKAVVEALCSIGSVYLEEDSRGALLPLTLARRARTLATLKVKDPSRELEQMLLMSLALGAMEVIGPKTCPMYEELKQRTGHRHEMSTPRAYILHSNCLRCINHQQVY
jgi:Fungal Zn(2)-Cys(6) binuclear cluster domain